MEDPLWNIERISDWDSRIAHYPDNIKRFYHKMIPKVQELKDMANIDDGWSNMVRDKKNDITIDQRKSANGLLTMRASGHINYPAIDIWRCINYNEWRKQWDANTDDIYFMGKIGAGAYHMYNRSRKIFVVAGREFLMDFFTF